MISTPDRQQAVTLIAVARTEGARLEPACTVVGITVRTHQRWTREGDVREDQRPLVDRGCTCQRIVRRGDAGDPGGLPSTGPVKGTYYYLAMIIDIFSRKVVGWEVFLGESADNARGVLERAVLAEREHSC